MLLVEDDELLRLCLSEMLAETGLQVIEAADGERALDLADAARPPALVVSDVNLGPGMDGFALAEALRRMWPDVRVLLISGVHAHANRRRFGPGERFLPKPFTCAALLRTVDALVTEGPAAPSA